MLDYQATWKYGTEGVSWKQGRVEKACTTAKQTLRIEYKKKITVYSYSSDSDRLLFFCEQETN